MVNVIRSIPRMMKFSLDQKKKGRTIGFVPTMGALHEGHLSLVKKARKENDVVVVSVFVNPAQFGPKEDLKKYPRDIKRDKALLSKEKIDAIFYPSAKAMYSADHETYIYVEGLSQKLCGRSRPGHFRGVATVVLKLFNIVKPDKAYFGMKDFQQQVIIKKMVKDLNLDVNIISMPIIREKDGLAMSSRNKYLNANDRERSAILSRALMRAKDMVKRGEKRSVKVKSLIAGALKNEKNIRIDYISVCDPVTLSDIDVIKGKTAIALAVHVNKTRLIDNTMVS